MNTRNAMRIATAAAFVAVWMLGPGAPRAHAYIDPGTGSSIIGSIGILFAVTSAFAAVAFQHVREFFSWMLGKVGISNRKQHAADESTRDSA